VPRGVHAPTLPPKESLVSTRQEGDLDKAVPMLKLCEREAVATCNLQGQVPSIICVGMAAWPCGPPTSRVGGKGSAPIIGPDRVSRFSLSQSLRVGTWDQRHSVSLMQINTILQNMIPIDRCASEYFPPDFAAQSGASSSISNSHKWIHLPCP
jgi:hypothetical protein